MKIEQLNWDSEFFGIKIGRVIIADKINFDPIKFTEQVIEERFELVYVFSLNKILPDSKIKMANIELMDIMLTMSKKFNSHGDFRYELRTELLEEELNDCYNIAEEISVVSRFYREEKIGPIKTKKFYRKWIDNALNQSFSDGLFLSKVNQNISGVHMVKTDEVNGIGHCSIIGVRADYKGQGIGKNLWEQAYNYWTDKNIHKCIVPFSIQNIDSFNFHLKIGFDKIEEIKYIYHYRKG